MGVGFGAVENNDVAVALEATVSAVGEGTESPGGSQGECAWRVGLKVIGDDVLEGGCRGGE